MDSNSIKTNHELAEFLKKDLKEHPETFIMETLSGVNGAGCFVQKVYDMGYRVSFEQSLVRGILGCDPNIVTLEFWPDSILQMAGVNTRGDAFDKLPDNVRAAAGIEALDYFMKDVPEFDISNKRIESKFR